MHNDPIRAISRELLEVQRTLGWMDLVIGNINDAVYVTDKDSLIVFANEYFASIVATPRVFLLGEKIEKVFPVVTASKILAEYAQSRAEKLENENEDVGIYEWHTEDGELKIFKISSRLLPTTEQKVYLAQNITREYELAKMKSSFIDLASHQLRTPMTAVMTYAHLLNDGYVGELSPQQRKMTQTIVESSERMVKLVNDLLTITRAQNNTKDVHYKNVSLPGLFRKINTEVSSALTDKNLQFLIEIPDDIPPVKSDRNLLHEIFSNLVVNAIQYTPKKGTIRVAATKKDGWLELAISDTGIGIPESYLSQMFTQFARADNAAETYPDGTGLGLYIVKLLLDKVGGTVECSSKLGKGTIFTVHLPHTSVV